MTFKKKCLEHFHVYYIPPVMGGGAISNLRRLRAVRIFIVKPPIKDGRF